MGIIRMIDSFFEDDRILTRKNIGISPIYDLNQMASMINEFVIKNASDEERIKLKKLFVGHLIPSQYKTTDGKYTVFIVKHFRWLTPVSHKVYLIDNTKENYKTAYKYGGFYYPSIRKAVNQYLYKPGEKLILPVYKRMWFQFAVILLIIAYFARACSLTDLKESLKSSSYADMDEQLQSKIAQSTSTEYAGSGYIITLTDDWEQREIDNENYDLVFINTVTLGDYYEADQYSFGHIFTELYSIDGYSGEELVEYALNSMETSENLTVISQPEFEETTGNNSSGGYCIEVCEPSENDDYDVYYRLSWFTPVGDTLYHFGFGSCDKSTYEKLKENVKEAFSSADFY